MRSGFPPVSLARRVKSVDGPSEELDLGEAGLIGLPEVGLALTFRPGIREWQGAWEEWSVRVFSAVLAPTMLECARFAERDQARELRTADLALATRLPGCVLPDARSEGVRLLAHLRGARSARWLTRFEAWADSGETPALFPTVFAARAALFHLPPQPMLLGYALLEWRAAARQRTAAGPLPVLGMPPEALAAVRVSVADLLPPALAAA